MYLRLQQRFTDCYPLGFIVIDFEGEWAQKWAQRNVHATSLLLSSGSGEGRCRGARVRTEREVSEKYILFFPDYYRLSTDIAFLSVVWSMCAYLADMEMLLCQAAS
jgi:hypothetical protein